MCSVDFERCWVTAYKICFVFPAFLFCSITSAVDSLQQWPWALYQHTALSPFSSLSGGNVEDVCVCLQFSWLLPCSHLLTLVKDSVNGSVAVYVCCQEKGSRTKSRNMYFKKCLHHCTYLSLSSGLVSALKWTKQTMKQAMQLLTLFLTMRLLRWDPTHHTHPHISHTPFFSTLHSTALLPWSTLPF